MRLARKHENLAALFRPKHRRRRVATGEAVKTGQSPDHDPLIPWWHHNGGPPVDRQHRVLRHRTHRIFRLTHVGALVAPGDPIYPQTPVVLDFEACIHQRTPAVLFVPGHTRQWIPDDFAFEHDVVVGDRRDVLRRGDDGGPGVDVERDGVGLFHGGQVLRHAYVLTGVRGPNVADYEIAFVLDKQQNNVTDDFFLGLKGTAWELL